MRKVPVEQAVGMTLGYDITRIIPGKEKYRAFRRGHIITEQDVSQLKDMGKENVYIWNPADGLTHEDDAALRLARMAAGEGLEWTEPSTGRVNIKAIQAGLLKVNVAKLNELNCLEDIVMATLHNNRAVDSGQIVAGTRVVPIAVGEDILKFAEDIGAAGSSILTVKPFRPLQVAVVTTGREVSNGRIKDGSEPVMKQKIEPFGGIWLGQVIVPDIPSLIAKEILSFIDQGAELILVTGGMSVDADDVTPEGIRNTGARVVFYGAPVLPGSQFMLAYKGDIPICGVPGGALFSRHTTLDLLLPRIFAGDMISRSEIANMGHGGLCDGCEPCHFPSCPFGKSS